MTKTIKDAVSHLQARTDDGVEEDQRWASEIKNKGRPSKNNKMEAPRTTMMLSVSNGQRGGGSRPINRTYSTGLCYKPVLKALPRSMALAGAKGGSLAPVGNTNRR